MRIEKNSGTLPSWLDSFVNKIQNKKVATKNVKNLPTVTWKNETYYVNLTDDGAVLYNDQANEVMSMDGVKSIEQVNDELNKDSVVASKTKLADDGNDSTDSQIITEDNGSGDDVEASKSNYFDIYLCLLLQFLYVVCQQYPVYLHVVRLKYLLHLY